MKIRQGLEDLFAIIRDPEEREEFLREYYFPMRAAIRRGDCLLLGGMLKEAQERFDPYYTTCPEMWEE